MRIAGLSVTSIVVMALTLVVTGAAGASLTKIGPWYRDLRKPWWNPPNWLFGPAWTVIYAFTGSAIVLAWNAPTAQTGQRTALVATTLTNFALNVLWSALFFARRRPDWALVEVVALWLSIVAMIWAARSLSRPAVWLLVPYLCWTTFAAYLNLRIVALNRPFPQS